MRRSILAALCLWVAGALGADENIKTGKPAAEPLGKWIPAMVCVSNDAGQSIIMARADPSSKRWLVDASGAVTTLPSGPMTIEQPVTVLAEGFISDGSSGASVEALVIGGKDSIGNVRTVGVTSGGVMSTVVVAASADSISNTIGGNQTGSGAATNGQTEVRTYFYNNSSWDRPRNNTDATLLASTGRTATTNSADQTNYNNSGVWVVLNITAVPGVDTVTINIQGKDPVSGSYVNLLTGAAQVGTGTTEYAVYPGVTETATVDVSRPLPRVWRVSVTHSGAGSFTYSVGSSTLR
jgi:hypothetical protein